MTSPTQQAQNRFSRAHRYLKNVWATDNDAEHAVQDGLREALKELVLGMDQLAVGLRATYQLLEKVQAEVESLKRTQRVGP